MSSQHNDFAYGKQFDGNLRGASESSPVRINTNVRLVMRVPAQEVERHRDQMYDITPRYTLTEGGSLPLHPTLAAMAVGRHYFTW